MSRARLLMHSARMLRRYRLRSAFVAFGTLVGVAALTLVISVGEGASRKVMKTVRQLFGSSSILVIAGGSELFGGPRADAARLTIDDIQAVANAVPGIQAWDPQVALPRASVRHADATTTARVLGQSERSREVWNRGVSRGDYFDAQAVASSARVALIGETLAARLFGRGDPIGSDVLVESVPFRVIGVLERFGSDIHGMDRDNELVVPISTMQRRVLNVDTIVLAKFLASGPDATGPTGKAIAAALRERHGITGDRPDDFTMITAAEIQKMVGFIQRVLFVYLPLAAAICLLTGAIIAAALMLSSVTARVPEIGLRRAVGALPGDIGFQFIAETVLTTIVGGLAGVMLGFAVAWLASIHLNLGDVFSLRAVVAGVLSSIVVGLLAGVLPARRAAGLQPVDALR